MMRTDGLAKLEANVPHIARSLKLLANKQRIHILCRLAAATDELPIAAIATDLGMSQSALSQHLAKLRRSGAITARRAGHNLFYRIADARVAVLLIALQEILKARRGRSNPPNFAQTKIANINYGFDWPLMAQGGADVPLIDVCIFRPFGRSRTPATIARTERALL
jgi:ArsR family transcriptional regulator